MVKENGMIMISEKEFNEREEYITQLEESGILLRKALIQLTSNREPSEVKVSRKDFVQMFNDAVDDMFKKSETNEDENDIYGYDVTVHWHGIYCDCGDGAIPANNIIPAIKGADEELDGEEW